MTTQPRINMTIGLSLEDYKRTKDLHAEGIKIINIYRLGLDKAEAQNKIIKKSA